MWLKGLLRNTRKRSGTGGTQHTNTLHHFFSLQSRLLFLSLSSLFCLSLSDKNEIRWVRNTWILIILCIKLKLFFCSSPRVGWARAQPSKLTTWLSFFFSSKFKRTWHFVFFRTASLKNWKFLLLLMDGDWCEFIFSPFILFMISLICPFHSWHSLLAKMLCLHCWSADPRDLFNVCKRGSSGTSPRAKLVLRPRRLSPALPVRFWMTAILVFSAGTLKSFAAAWTRCEALWTTRDWVAPWAAEAEWVAVAWAVVEPSAEDPGPTTATIVSAAVVAAEWVDDTAVPCGRKVMFCPGFYGGNPEMKEFEACNSHVTCCLTNRIYFFKREVDYCANASHVLYEMIVWGFVLQSGLRLFLFLLLPSGWLMYVRVPNGLVYVVEVLAWRGWVYVFPAHINAKWFVFLTLQVAAAEAIIGSAEAAWEGVPATPIVMSGAHGLWGRSAAMKAPAIASTCEACPSEPPKKILPM